MFIPENLTNLLIYYIILCILYYWFCIRPHNYWRKLGVLQGEALWFFGDSWSYVFRQQSFAEFLQYLYKKYPKARYYGAYLFNYPILVVRDPELIKFITVRDFENFTDHSSWLPENVDPLWSNNLFSLKGQKWKDLRNFFRPTFTSSKMKTMYRLMHRCADNFVQFFEEKETDLIEADFEYIFKRFTCNVIGITVFGVRIDSLRKPDNKFYELGLEATNVSGIRSFLYILHYIVPEVILKFLRVKIYSHRVRTFFTDLVEDTIKTRTERNIYRPDMIHLILEAKKGKKNNEEEEEEEEEDVVDKGFAVAQEEVKETFRKWPSGLAVERVCTQPYTLEPKVRGEKEIVLKTGTLVCIPTFGIHRDPCYYPNPEVFDPERFSEERKGTINPYTYFPFGLGPRNCIGSRFAILEAKVLFVHLLRSFEIVSTAKSKIPIKINKSNFHLDGNGFWFGLKKIKNVEKWKSM